MSLFSWSLTINYCTATCRHQQNRLGGSAAYLCLEVYGMRPTKQQRSVPGAPKGELASRTLAMSTDTNPMGHIFGGWIMSHMDAAGKMTATEHANGRVVTVAVSRIVFLAPVAIGDTVSCYTDVARIGHTSITLDVEVWVLRQGQGDRVKVTEAEFTFVAVDDAGDPRPISQVREAAAVSA
jgi:acyl-CoA thioesterase YciA